MSSELKQTEQYLMLAIMRKRPEAYGISLFEELQSRLGREIPLATIYATLEKLEKKGFVRSWQGPATAERGGRAKMYFDITGRGQTALTASLRELESLRAGVEIAGAYA